MTLPPTRRSRQEAPLKPAHIVAIASGKGGVGKTWLAITLAHLTARAGKRTLLFDGDLGLANIDVQLGLSPTRDVSDVVRHGASLAEVITPYAPQFDIIAGRSGSGSLSALPVPRLAHLSEEILALRANYDLIFLDLSAGIEDQVRALALLADTCLVVATDEPTSLTDAYAFVKLTHAAPVKLAFVINQAASFKEGEATYGALHHACQSFLQLSVPCLGIIRKDGKVKDAIRHQSPLLTRAPLSTAAADAAQIAIKLMQG